MSCASESKGEHDRRRDPVQVGCEQRRRAWVERGRVVRQVEAGVERRLQSFEFAAWRDPLDARTLEAISIGVSTRKYARSLDPLPEGELERSVSRSAVSRRFVAMSSRVLTAWLSEPLDQLDIRVVIIDGLFFRDHCVLMAPGVTSDGGKRALGLREGSAENTVVAKGLLSDLIERGLRAERPCLFVIDRSKGIRKAIGDFFGELGVVHLALVKSGHGQITAVVGAPGVGKSRLLHEFKLASQSGCLLLEARPSRPRPRLSSSPAETATRLWEFSLRTLPARRARAAGPSDRRRSQP